MASASTRATRRSNARRGARRAFDGAGTGGGTGGSTFDVRRVVTAIGRLRVGVRTRRDSARSALSTAGGEALQVPVRLWSPGGGSLREVTADLTVVGAHAGTHLHLQGSYRWDGGGHAYGGGLLAHRLARWLAIDLVHGADEQLLVRSG